MRLLENYIEAMLLKNTEMRALARTNDTRAHHATVVARVMREIIHERMVVLDIDVSVQALVNEHLSGTIEHIAQLPPQILTPSLPPDPLLLDFGEGQIVIQEVSTTYAPVAGMVFQCPGDRNVMREARSRLSTKYHDAIDEVIKQAQTTWTLSALDVLGNEILTYQYRPDSIGHWSWFAYPGHQCPFNDCRYSQQGILRQTCDRCEAVKALVTMMLGLFLLYDAGFFQHIQVIEEKKPRTDPVNLREGIGNACEGTRPITIRHISKNVLVKEMHVPRTVVNPRGSWLARHQPEEIETDERVRQPFDRRTRNGAIVHVTPTNKKRMPRLKRNSLARTVVELYADAQEKNDESS